MKEMDRARLWPDLSGLDLTPTLEALHLWSQVVGKIRLMLTPWENHGWHVPLYLSPRGLTTGLVPVPGRAFTLEFDLFAGELALLTSAGDEKRIRLAQQSVATFYEGVLDAVRSLGIEVTISAMPTEIAEAVRFDADHERRVFDLAAARTYWRALIEVHRVFQLFRTRFLGKVSPIHLFWGAFDLAVTRFSGRTAPAHPGGAPFMNDAIAREAYSHEVSSAGFWPNLGEPEGPLFYSYAYPAPDGFTDAVVARAADDPDAVLLSFLQSTYEAAAEAAGWDRAVLEREQGRLGVPPEGS